MTWKCAAIVYISLLASPVIAQDSGSWTSTTQADLAIPITRDDVIVASNFRACIAVENGILVPVSCDGSDAKGEKRWADEQDEEVKRLLSRTMSCTVKNAEGWCLRGRWSNGASWSRN